MTNEELRQHLGSQIAERRKAAGLTQAELAEKLNYSDKAVSKWERAESVPDVMTLVLLAELFGTDVDSMLGAPVAESSESLENSGSIPENPPVSPSGKSRDKTARRGLIQKLCTILVWFVALFVYVIVDAFQVPCGWMAFFAAVPVNAIVLLSLRSAWHMYSWNKILISAIMWGALVCLYMSFWLGFQVNIWRIFLLGLLGQAAIVFLFRLFPPKETGV